jgi:hypothetical protein
LKALHSAVEYGSAGLVLPAAAAAVGEVKQSIDVLLCMNI